MTCTLVLLRHGQSEWNADNLFTGWFDSDLTNKGREEARHGGALMAGANVLPDVVHTSLQVRAIRTANIALDEMDRLWIPVRRDWRLNERHYGALQGQNKKQTTEEYGAEQVKIWRRAYDIPPPPMDWDDEHHPRFDPRYADLDPRGLPSSECLKDVVERMLPYWFDDIVPDLRDGMVTLVAAHGNSLRALVKHLDEISDEDIVDLNIPTGMPLVFELDDDLRPTEQKPITDRYLDPEAAAEAAAAVAKQAG